MKATTRKKAKEIKKKYAADPRFDALFNEDVTCLFDADGACLGLRPKPNYSSVSECFSPPDLAQLMSLACETRLDLCGGFPPADTSEYRSAPLHALNALLQLLAGPGAPPPPDGEALAKALAKRCSSLVP